MLIHWDFFRSKPIYTYNLGLSTPKIGQIVNPPFVHSLDYNHQRVAAALGDTTIQFIDLNAKRSIGILEAHSSSVAQVIFPNFEPNNHMISAGNDSCIYCWCIPNSAFDTSSNKLKKKKGTKNKIDTEIQRTIKNSIKF